MLTLALRNLWDERGRLAISVGGVAAALLLLLVLDGVYAGTSQQIVAYLERTDADAWVMQRGVSNMHMATSVVPARLEQRIESVDGVLDATPILYASALVRTNDEYWFSYVVGIRPADTRGGPWAMRSGKAIPGPGEAVIPAVRAQQQGLAPGDEMEAAGGRYRVAGFSEQTFSIANSIVFVSYADMEQRLGLAGAASYLLVKAEPGVAADELVARLRASLPEFTVLSSRAFAGNDRATAKQMGLDVVRIMTLVGFVIGALVIGLNTYAATVRRSREYGIAKALGMTNGSLLGVVGVQTAVTGLLSAAVAVAVAFALRPLLALAAPDVTLQYEAQSALRLLGMAIGIAAAAALLPAIAIARVEPAVAFREG